MFIINLEYLIRNIIIIMIAIIIGKLEGCIDDERQFKTAKRPQVPGDATVRKRFFRDNFVIFRLRSKRITFSESVNFSTCDYMQIFNFRNGHVTTFGTLQGSIFAKCLVTDSPD